MKLIVPSDKVCYNCDNYIRDEKSQEGKCILKEKGTRYDNDEACKRFIKRDKELDTL